MRAEGVAHGHEDLVGEGDPPSRAQHAILVDVLRDPAPAHRLLLLVQLLLVRQVHVRQVRGGFLLRDRGAGAVVERLLPLQSLSLSKRPLNMAKV